MIDPKHITKKQALRIIEMLEQQTRAEIMGRLGPMQCFSDYYLISIHKMDRLRKYVFGTSDLVRLGYKWKLLKKESQKGKGKR